MVISYNEGTRFGHQHPPANMDEVGDKMVLNAKKTMAIILLLVFVIIIPVNIFLLRIHSQFGGQTTFKFLIRSLLVSDLAIGVGLICELSIVIHLSLTEAKCQTCELVIDTLTNQVVDGLTKCSAGIIACIAVDRFQAICRPHKRSLTLVKTKFIVLFLWIISLVWIAVDIYGAAEVAYWKDIVAYVGIIVISFIQILVVILYVRICKRVRDRVKIRAISQQYKNREKKEAKPSPRLILETLHHSHPRGARTNNNLDTISKQVTTSVDQNSTVKFVHDSSGTSAEVHHSLKADMKPIKLVSRSSAKKTENITMTPQIPIQVLPVNQQRGVGVGQQHLLAKISLMLIITTIIHFISWYPSVSCSLIRVIYGQIPNTSTLHIALWGMKHFCYATVALNPFIYGLSNGEFRREFREGFKQDFQVCICKIGCQCCKL